MNRRDLTILLIFSIVGILVTYELANLLVVRIQAELPLYDPLPILPGTAASDSVRLIEIIIPLTLLIYLLFSLPVAALYMIGNKFAKIGAYQQGIIRVGERFGIRKMVYRSVSPALFALTFGQTILTFVPDFIIREPTSAPPAVIPLLAPLFSILSALVVLTVGVFLFVPTWLLNDSGIVYFLKQDELTLRRCPDTMGVGRWVSNFLGGYSLLGYPISAFFAHFYKPFFIQNVTITNIELFFSAFWTVGLPLLTMAFVMPVIILNELALRFMSKRVRKFARSIGASDVRLERLVKA